MNEIKYRERERERTGTTARPLSRLFYKYVVKDIKAIYRQNAQ